MNDYDVEISDLDAAEDESTITRKKFIKFFNKSIKNRMSDADTPKGVEVDIPPQWQEFLLNEYSILDEYKKMGWKVMWYQKHSDGPAKGKLLRSWVSFRSLSSIKDR